jgi:hypothetical protein
MNAHCGSEDIERWRLRNSEEHGVESIAIAVSLNYYRAAGRGRRSVRGAKADFCGLLLFRRNKDCVSAALGNIFPRVKARANLVISWFDSRRRI